MYCLLIFLALFNINLSLTTLEQKGIDYFATNVKVTYNVKDNRPPNTFDAEIILKNDGMQNISGTWHLYFSHVRLITKQNFTHNIPNIDLELDHIDGSLYLIKQKNINYILQSNSQISLKFKPRLWLVARTDNMPNWYVVNENLLPRTIHSTINEDLTFTGPFDKPEKWKRSTQDKYDPFNAAKRFDNYIDNKGTKGKIVIPTPYQHKILEGEINLENDEWVIVNTHNEFQNEANYLSKKLNMKVLNNNIGISSFYIEFTKFPFMVSPSLERKESYGLIVDPDKLLISIISDEPVGIFHGVQTLISILESYKAENEKRGRIPALHLADGPRYPYRGLHLDVSRNFHDVQTIKTILETMAMYKLNKFHFHLTDDEGWRLEIPGIPEITDKGAKRCHSKNFADCISPQFGSGPTSSSSGSGYYTVDEYKDILTYAKERHIEVIPEFDMPGHCHAAIQSLKNHLTYALSDPDDTSEYLSVQYYKDNAVNPCINSTYAFVAKVVEEVKRLHQNIQPLKVFNIGGDEVAKSAWIGSKICKEKYPNTTNVELKKIFMQKVSEIVKNENLDLAAWQDGLIDGVKPFPKDDLANEKIYAYLWDNIWEFGKANLTYVFANSNYSVVLSHATHLYFDHPNEPDPEERGFYWATRYTPIDKVFAFRPDSVYDNIDVNRNGDPIVKDQFCQNGVCVNLTKPENIVGMQGHVWSETIRTSNQLHSMLYPRLLALAERAWHKADWEQENVKDEEKKRKEDWSEFAHALGNKELKRLDKMNIHYYLNVPGAKVDGAKLKARTTFPGMPIMFKQGDENLQLYKENIQVKNDKTITLVTG
ncbi:DgyrCDS12374 [Dimorphilus gyrociliatus]|uniref:beta-N-acetylhexosaminidase n=1 Tax=Dimorphilus gyrociliatus TaxID=2664684 RepID=A0A7I8W691_9ANNE|nr:DgyrCDS12374 [Dimorphilus gyrociliatus]